MLGRPQAGCNRPDGVTAWCLVAGAAQSPRRGDAPQSSRPQAGCRGPSGPPVPVPRGEPMATIATGSPRPGVSVGPTSEFSLFFRVKPGESEALRSALQDLQDTPGYRPGDYGMAIRTIHEARFVLFDND